MASSNKSGQFSAPLKMLGLGLGIILLCFALGYVTRQFWGRSTTANDLPLLDGDDAARRKAMEEAKQQGKDEYEYTTNNPPPPLRGAAP